MVLAGLGWPPESPFPTARPATSSGAPREEPMPKRSPKTTKQSRRHTRKLQPTEKDQVRPIDQTFSASRILTQPQADGRPVNDRARALRAAFKHVWGGGLIPTRWQGGHFTSQEKYLMLAISQYRDVKTFEPKAKVHAAIVEGGRHGGRERGKARKSKATQWQNEIQDYYRRNPPTRSSSYHAEAARLLRVSELNHKLPGKETLRKFLAKSRLGPTRFRSPSPHPQ